MPQCTRTGMGSLEPRRCCSGQFSHLSPKEGLLLFTVDPMTSRNNPWGRKTYAQLISEVRHSIPTDITDITDINDITDVNDINDINDINDKGLTM